MLFNDIAVLEPANAKLVPIPMAYRCRCIFYAKSLYLRAHAIRALGLFLVAAHLKLL